MKSRSVLLLLLILAFCVGLFSERAKETELGLEILRLTNQVRQENNLPPLESDIMLADIAHRHNLNMINYGFLDSEDHAGHSLNERRLRCYPQMIALAMGENLLRLEDRQKRFDAKAIFDSWMNSAEQRANILSTEYSHVGIDVSILGKTLVANQTFALIQGITEVSNAEFEQQIWRLTNVKRKEHNLPPLAYDDGLAALAKRHSQNMLDYGFFDHKDQRGRKVDDRRREFYPEMIVSSIGENLARFYNKRRVYTAAEIVEGWMNSPGHRENILNPNYTHLGVGVIGWGSVLLATQNFATPLVKLKSPIPRKLSRLRVYKLEFSYLSSRAIQELSSVLRFPRSDFKYPVSQREYSVGWKPLAIQWTTPTDLSIDLDFPAGSGKYSLGFGWNGSYFNEGIVIRVR